MYGPTHVTIYINNKVIIILIYEINNHTKLLVKNQKVVNVSFAYINQFSIIFIHTG